ncbi:TetR/AcrR family transcriptional regulator C-terminal ligand-binding domain-containing protein [Nonomuraea sp. NPDC050310]|uniref:TetR/AcrR family transcriptional regulator n=1 Tax=Nonomuraea sp. NPDC050310 TaxID=3154935 RepID=UPI0033D1BBAD
MTGRPRDEKVDQAILAATREVLGEVGYARLTMDAVAARAGAGKAALYRRYATKQEMVFAAAVHGLDLELPPDTGALASDLRALVGDIVSSLTGPATHAAVPGLLADLGADPALAARFHQTFVARQQDVVAGVLRRAVERGELDREPEVGFAQALLVGPVFLWVFMLNRPERDSFVRDLGDRVAAALLTA